MSKTRSKMLVDEFVSSLMADDSTSDATVAVDGDRPLYPTVGGEYQLKSNEEFCQDVMQSCIICK